MKSLTRIFLTGLGTVLPLVLTVYLLFWFTSATESLLRQGIRLVLSDKYYTPGLGIILAVLIILIVGLLMKTWLARQVFSWWNSLLLRLPLIKSVYRMFQDFVRFITEPRDKGMQQVVSMQLGESNMRVLGFVTQNDLKGLPDGLADDDRVAVYLPLSYQIGGMTVFVPRDCLTPVDMSLQEAMRFSVTAGLSNESSNSDEEKGL